MKRIQFYPNSQLDVRLGAEAQKVGVSISALVVDILNKHFELTHNNMLSITDLTSKVFDEVQSYVSSHVVGDEFELLSASATYATIEMVSNEKPSTIRARIGKNFSQKIGKVPFENVDFARKSDLSIKKSAKNNATVYKII